MLPELFQKRIAALDELTFTDLVGRLLMAEAQALDLPPDGFTYSLETKVGDAGLDGEAKDVPAGRSTLFPVGSSGYQFKTVKGWFSDLRLENEVKQPGPRRILEGGGTYVLVWSRELNPRQQTEVQQELLRCASLITNRPKVEVWSASHIARLCTRYPAVPQSLGLVRFGPARSLARWLNSLKSEDRPFFADDARQGLIRGIRDRLSQSEGGLVVRVTGDSGVGKSRAVAEALNTDEFRDITFYAPSTEGLADFLSLIIGDDQLKAILVVDEVGATDLERLQEDVAAAGKRIRLVTIGLRGARRTLPGRDDLELEALSTVAMTELVKREVPGDNTAASFVAEAVEGYPQMAFEILEEIKRDRDSADLSRLAQTGRPRELLEKTVPEEFRRPLGTLALFQSVGCRGDLEPQLDEIVARFPVTKPELIHTIKNADDRYIRIAGRRCYVRPKLVATWLAGEILEVHGEDVIGWVEDLPSVLQDQFVNQLENFGSGPSTFREVLGTFIKQNQRFRRPSDFDEAAARFLRAAAAVAPEQVVSSIDELVETADAEELRTIPRRDLVRALEYLLWWRATYERAIRSLFILAEHESETWANNATGEFVESFQLVLGGTLVPHADRLRWLNGQLAESDPRQLVLIAKAAAAGLGTYHSRMVSGPRGQLEPQDWHPQNESEVIQAHRDSFELLFVCLDRVASQSSERNEILALIAGNLRAAIGFKLIDSVDHNLRVRDWTKEDRAAFSTALRDVRRYDKPSPELNEQIEGLLRLLSGTEFEERLATVFATKPWDLIEGDNWRDVPPAVEELVEEVTRDKTLLPKAIEIASTAPDDGSHFQFFMRCAERLGPATVVEAALAVDLPSWSVVAAALTQAQTADQAAWADELLRKALKDSPADLPTLLRSLPLTAARVDLVERAIKDGLVPADAFRELLFGAPIRHLDKANALRLVEAISSAETEPGMEAALGMLHQWLEVHPDETDSAVETTIDLAMKAAQFRRPSSMTSHYLQELFKQVPLGYEARGRIWKELATGSDVAAAQDHFALIQALLEENPNEGTDLILSILDEAVDHPYKRWAFPLEDGKLLSAAAKATSASKVWERLAAYDDTKLRYLLRHTSWAGNTPEPLIREFLLSDRRAGLEDEAFVNFFNDLGVVSGPFHLAMKSERDRAAGWLAALSGTPAEDWAKRLVASYEEHVKAEKIRDEERDLELR